MPSAFEQQTGKYPSQSQQKVEHAQRPAAAERPKTAVEAMETIKSEAERATAWSNHYDQQSSVVEARIAAVDERLNKVIAFQSHESSATVQAEYRAVLAERDAINARRTELNAMKQRLQAEYQPIKQVTEAASDIKTASEAIKGLQAREQVLRAERPALQARLDAFEAQEGPHEAQLAAQKAALEAQAAERTAVYAAKRAELQEWTEKTAMYLPLAMDKEGNMKPEYAEFLQRYSEAKGWMNQVDQYVQAGQPQLEAIGKELNSIAQYRSGLREALTANVTDLESASAQIRTQEQTLQAAERAHQEAVPAAQQNIWRRMAGAETAAQTNPRSVN
jgi:chromosome segregation ATPase